MRLSKGGGDGGDWSRGKEMKGKEMKGEEEVGGATASVHWNYVVTAWSGIVSTWMLQSEQHLLTSGGIELNFHLNKLYWSANEEILWFHKISLKAFSLLLTGSIYSPELGSAHHPRSPRGCVFLMSRSQAALPPTSTLGSKCFGFQIKQRRGKKVKQS